MKIKVDDKLKALCSEWDNLIDSGDTDNMLRIYYLEGQITSLISGKIAHITSKEGISGKIANKHPNYEDEIWFCPIHQQLYRKNIACTNCDGCSHFKNIKKGNKA